MNYHTLREIHCVKEHFHYVTSSHSLGDIRKNLLGLLYYYYTSNFTPVHRLYVVKYYKWWNFALVFFCVFITLFFLLSKIFLLNQMYYTQLLPSVKKVLGFKLSLIFYTQFSAFFIVFKGAGTVVEMKKGFWGSH